MVLPAASDQSSSSGYSDGVWDYSSGSLNKLPDVPAFPFPASPQVSLSLADALGIDETDCHTPLVAAPSLADMLDLPPTTPVYSPFAPDYATDYVPEVFSPYPLEYATEADTETDGFVFCIQIRKAEGIGFGLATSSGDGVLLIEGILPGGAVEAWNRQCSTSGSPEKVLLPGDAIVSVNNIGGQGFSAEDMKLEFETKTTLRILVVRSEGPRSAPPQHVASVNERCEFSTLRADASEFVPSGVCM